MKKEYELTEEDYKVLDTRNEFTATASSVIILGFQPYRDDYSPEDKSKIRNMNNSLEEAIRSGYDEFDISTGHLQSREAYKNFCVRHGLKPRAFFPETDIHTQQAAIKINHEQPFSFSKDFRSVKIGKTSFTTTTQQAQVLEILYVAYKDDSHDVSVETIFDRIGVKAEKNLKKAVFKKDCELYNLLIESKRKGTVRLKCKS